MLRRDGQRFVTIQEADKAAHVIKSVNKEVFLCSARTGDGIEELLQALLKVGCGRKVKERNLCVCM